MNDSWIRIIDEYGQTVAIVRLPLQVSQFASITKAWPDSFIAESESLRDCVTKVYGDEQVESNIKPKCHHYRNLYDVQRGVCSVCAGERNIR